MPDFEYRIQQQLNAINATLKETRMTQPQPQLDADAAFARFIDQVADASHYGPITVVTIDNLTGPRRADLSRALVNAGANTRDVAFVHWAKITTEEVGYESLLWWDIQAIEAYEERHIGAIKRATAPLRALWAAPDTHADGCTPTETDCTCDGA